MNIYLASDHGGFELKKQLLEFLNESSLFSELRRDGTISDLGPYTYDSDDDYTDYAFKLCKEVLEDEANRGILICKSGIGVSIAANKVKGIYAALCFEPGQAERARQHNDVNVLCLDSEFTTDFNLHSNMVREFLQTSFSSDYRHERRVREIKNFENRYLRTLD